MGTPTSAPRPDTSHMIELDRVGFAKVFIMPTAAQERTLKASIRLQLVGANGDPFTLKDLKYMCVDPRNILDLQELCKGRFERLCRKYLPSYSSKDITFVPHRCEIDSDGLVRVEFSLER